MVQDSYNDYIPWLSMVDRSTDLVNSYAPCGQTVMYRRRWLIRSSHGKCENFNPGELCDDGIGSICGIAINMVVSYDRESPKNGWFATINDY